MLIFVIFLTEALGSPHLMSGFVRDAHLLGILSDGKIIWNLVEDTAAFSVK